MVNIFLVAVSSLPNFSADPSLDRKSRAVEVRPHHQATIHINCEHSQLIHDAYVDAVTGRWSTRPVIEMTIPSVLDDSVAPKDAHVVQLFTQYTPYTLSGGRSWDDQTRNEYAETGLLHYTISNKIHVACCVTVFDCRYFQYSSVLKTIALVSRLPLWVMKF